MAERSLCMGCMSPLNEGDAKCAHCGYPVGGVNPPEYMRVRTVLGGRYLVGRVLEVSGDSAVYMGLDRQDDTPVTVREFFPTTLALRGDNGLLQVLPEKEAAFAAYKQKFLSCARAVARLRDVLAVVPYFDIFEENGTAYSISEYCKGVSLERYVRAKGPLSYEQVRHMFLPLLSAVSVIHTAGVLHLGICPKNVLVDDEGHLRIKNFCIPDTHTVNTACEPTLISGYAAPEQYEGGATITAAADVYGLAATMCFALTGQTPAAAPQRTKKGDELLMPAEVVDALPAHVQESLYRAMRVNPEYRTKTARQLLDELTATSAVAALIDEEEQTMEQPRKKKARNYLWLIFVGVVLALAIVAVFALHGLGFISFGGETAATTTTTQGELVMNTTTEAPIVTKATGSATVSVENLAGRVFADIADTELSGKMSVSLAGFVYDDAPRGTIVSQTPAAGDQAERGTVIAVVVSAGPAKQTMPDLNGWSEEHARLYLEALGFRIGETMLLQVSELDKGTVDHTMPAAGADVTAGEVITLFVSNVEQAADDPAADDPLADDTVPTTTATE